MKAWKKLAALIIAFVMLPLCVFAEEDSGEKIKVYIFGDRWAASWQSAFEDFLTDDAELICAAEEGSLLSGFEKNRYYREITAGDVVILSYGVLEKDYNGDGLDTYKKKLESAVEYITKLGASVALVSICSTPGVYEANGSFMQTKNFYTETTREWAAKNDIIYVDLARITAGTVNAVGVKNESRVYESAKTLTEWGARLCAEKTAEALQGDEKLKAYINIEEKLVYYPEEGEGGRTFDLFAEAADGKEFRVYVKDGSGVTVNGEKLADGDSEVNVAAADGRIDLKFTSVEAVQVSFVKIFDAGGVSTADEPYIIELENGCYDITVKKSEPLKASVFVNSLVVAVNLDMPGTEDVTECSEATFRGFEITTGKAEFTVSGLTDKLSEVKICDSAVIYGDKPRIFLAGDSTVCNYYPTSRSGEEEDGTVMTGWGMYLSQHTSLDVANFAASGEWAASWKEKYFESVLKEGKKGDYFIIQFGINDHDYSTKEEMTAALSQMTDEAVKIGMIPIVVSPQISAGYGWGETGDVGKSDGGAYAEMFEAVRDFAQKKGCFFVDLTDMSAGWFSEMGREAVYKKYHLWDYENDEPLDMMHLSSKGARAMCTFFVTAIEAIKTGGKTDFWGNDLNTLTLW
ncbi:MAG: GDSL-type esterase/lipase family protein [Clostridia bacterium]|nr:GDSL-type esterase/lipase family protein [Clostridia bacterium]